MKTIIRVGMSTCGLAAGAQATYTALEQAVRARDLPVSLQRTGCVGAAPRRGRLVAAGRRADPRRPGRR